MKRTYCDICEQPIEGERKPDLTNRIAWQQSNKLEIEVRFGTTDYQNSSPTFAGDVCLFCVLDAIKKLDPRPQPVEALPTVVPIEYFRECHGLKWKLHDSANVGYGASFEGCEVKDGAILRSTWGSGSTPAAAKIDYAKAIAGKLLVVDAMKDTRREIQVPAGLFYNDVNDIVADNGSYIGLGRQEDDDFANDMSNRT